MSEGLRTRDPRRSVLVWGQKKGGDVPAGAARQEMRDRFLGEHRAQGTLPAFSVTTPLMPTVI